MSLPAVHLKGTSCLTRHAVAHWRAKHKAGEPVCGRIINTTSAALLGNPGQANYASDAAGWISGQVFAAYGDRIHLTKGWHRVASIEKQGAGWTAEELVAAMPKLAGMAPVPMIEQLGI